MIKEIGHEVDNEGYCKFGSMKLVSNIEDPYDNNIPLEEFNKHYKEQLDKVEVVQLKRTSRFKHGDWINLFFNRSHLMCVSKHFKDVFEGKLKGYWYPTTDKEYFIFLLDNYVEAFDMDKTIIKYDLDSPNSSWGYRWIKNEKFKKEIENSEYLFSMKEECSRMFCTQKFEQLVNENALTGIQVFKKMSFTREDWSSFDRSRAGKYDKEGNLI